MPGRISANNTSQQHGLEFENLIKVSRMFCGAANVARTGHESFDVEGACDPKFGLATSVKTAKGDWIGLADAERFCQIGLPWRLIHGPWVQEDARIKRYDAIHEMIIPLGVMRKVVGDLTPERVLGWHNDIASFAAGEEGATAARQRRDEILAEIRGRHGILRLDFKIDHLEQRRLQFSIRLSRLAELLKDLPDYQGNGHSQPLHVIHAGEFHQYPLPIRLISPPRRIDKTLTAAASDDAILFEREEMGAPCPAQEPVAAAAAEYDPLHALFGAAPPRPLRRAVPVRREERERRRLAAADTRQIPLFG